MNPNSLNGWTRIGVDDVTYFLDGSDIRELSIAGRRILTRLYVAIRDEAWNTVPFSCSAPEILEEEGRCNVRLRCKVDEEQFKAEWFVNIGVTSDGQFEYAMDGRMLANFRYAKIGLNLHHPLPETLGSRYIARLGDKRIVGRIPTLIEPQYFVDGKLTGMFMPYEDLTLQRSTSDEIRFTFLGDEFEMQDHRNWTDYNLKSYSTPLSVPLPLVAVVGQRIFQAVKINGSVSPLPSNETQPLNPPSSDVDVYVDRSRIVALPRLGSELPDNVWSLDASMIDYVEKLDLDYIRINLDLTSEEAAASGFAKVNIASEWDYPLELVLVVSPGEINRSETVRLSRLLASIRSPIERVIVLEGPLGLVIGRMATTGSKMRFLRKLIEKQCGPVVLVLAIDQFFADLNRFWPELAGVDGVGYAICPQVHASDDISLMENVWGQSDTVLTARARSGGSAIHIISVRLIGKFGPYPSGVPDVAELASYGDPRQYMAFGAAWTVGSLCQLIDAEATSATYFELAGDRGLVQYTTDSQILESAARSCLPGPIYKVLEVVKQWKNGNIVRIGKDQGSRLLGVGMEWPDRTEFLLANLCSFSRRVSLSNLSGKLLDVSDLDSGNRMTPAGWIVRADGNSVVSESSTAVLEFGPYGVVRVRTIL